MGDEMIFGSKNQENLYDLDPSSKRGMLEKAMSELKGQRFEDVIITESNLYLKTTSTSDN
jgi:hypothetical protein